MRSKQIVCGLVVVALMGGVSSRVRAQAFPWWAFDSVIEEVQDRGTLRVGLGLFEPWSACNADGELIGFWGRYREKSGRGHGGGGGICADELELHHPGADRRGV